MKLLVHKGCGGEVLKWVGTHWPPVGVARSVDVIRLDGTIPKPGELMRELCAGCGQSVRIPCDVEAAER